MAGVTSGFGELLRTGSYSDFKITCKGTEFKVHKAIVCSASDFFKTMCDSGFKVSPCPIERSRLAIDRLQEQSEGSVDLPDDDPAIIKHVIDFIYTGTYEAYAIDTEIDNMSFEEEAIVSSRGTDHASTTEGQNSDDGQRSGGWGDGGSPNSDPYDLEALQPGDKIGLANLKNHTIVYGVADKLGIQGLSDYVLDWFKENLNGLSWRARQDANFVHILTLVYETTGTYDRGIRAQVTRDCIAWNRPDWVDSEAVVEVVEKYEPMAFYLGRETQDRVNRQPPPPHDSHCHSWGCEVPHKWINGDWV